MRQLTAGGTGKREPDMQDGETNEWMKMTERKDNFTVAQLAWLHPNCPCWLWTDFFPFFGQWWGEGVLAAYY